MALSVTDKPVESSMRLRLGTLRLISKRSRKSTPRKEKRATKAKVEFEHALAIRFNARWVDGLERKTTVELLAICK